MRLREAVEAAGGEPRPANALELVDEISRAISPMRLPAELVEFWKEIGDRSVHSWPEFCGPDFALESWRRGRDEFPGQAPANFLTIAYASWNCMSIELDNPYCQGGAIFQWSLDGEDFVLRHHRLGDWLDHLTTLIEDGKYRVGKWRDEPPIVSVDDDQAGAGPGREAAVAPHPTYGSTAIFEKDPVGWPAHWQRLSGIEATDLAPHGATHTIAGILDAAAQEPAQGTIRAVVRGIAGQKDTNARVEDETGTVDILCPAATTALGPTLGEHFEFDVVVSPPEEMLADEPAVTREPEPETDADRLLRAWERKYPLGPARAIATAIRRCEPPET
jgi:hypothetical protein